MQLIHRLFGRQDGGRWLNIDLLNIDLLNIDLLNIDLGKGRFSKALFSSLPLLPRPLAVLLTPLSLPRRLDAPRRRRAPPRSPRVVRVLASISAVSAPVRRGREADDMPSLSRGRSEPIFCIIISSASFSSPGGGLLRKTSRRACENRCAVRQAVSVPAYVHNICR
jgi:hypothetical protein